MKPSLDAKGREVPDPKPLALPLGFKRPETLQEQVQRLIRTSMSAYAQAHDQESFEDADDFDIEDDPLDPSTPYEMEFDPVLGREVSPAEFAQNVDYYKSLYERASTERAQASLDPPSTGSKASEARSEGEAEAKGGSARSVEG